MEGVIFEIQRYCLHDGPGIRTTVFLKGCSLKCMWCHNPEGQSFSPQIMFNEKKCIGCGRCEGVDASKCQTKARQIAGESISTEKLYNKLMADEPFWGDEGGVTFSGGEALCQSKFIKEVMHMLHSSKVHIAIETAGHVPFSSFEDVLPYNPLFLFDIKAASANLHKQGTGADNLLIIENLKKISALGAKFIIRIPVIGNYNDSDSEITAIANIINSLETPPIEVELLQYHKLGQHKHEQLGSVSVMDDRAEVPDERMRELRALMKKHVPSTLA